MALGARVVSRSARRYLDVYARHGLTGPRTIYGHGVHLAESDFAFLHATDTALAHCPTSNNFLGSGLFDLQGGEALARVLCAWHSRPTWAAAPASRCCARCRPPTRSRSCAGTPLPPSCALYLATRGAAHALDLDDRIGSVAPGTRGRPRRCSTSHSTPLIDFRMRYARDFDEMLAIQMALGDDRAVRATYVAGNLAYERQ